MKHLNNLINIRFARCGRITMPRTAAVTIANPMHENHSTDDKLLDQLIMSNAYCRRLDSTIQGTAQYIHPKDRSECLTPISFNPDICQLNSSPM